LICKIVNFLLVKETSPNACLKVLWEHWKCFEKWGAASDESISRARTELPAVLFGSAEEGVPVKSVAQQAESVSRPY
jgi:hypothetical protein